MYSLCRAVQCKCVVRRICKTYHVLYFEHTLFSSSSSVFSSHYTLLLLYYTLRRRLLGDDAFLSTFFLENLDDEREMATLVLVLRHVSQTKIPIPCLAQLPSIHRSF